MLDVTEDSVKCEPTIGSSDRQTTIIKPYLKFGVSAILGLDIRHDPQSPLDTRSSPLRPEEVPHHLKSNHGHFHHPSSINEPNDTSKNVSYHPVYHLHSYFHPLIQQQSASKPNFSGKKSLMFN